MRLKVVVHSTTKRFLQVVGIALCIAGALVGLKKLSQPDLDAPHTFPLASGSPEANSGPVADLLVGRSSVIDGDTLEIHGTRIRLEGIDAPESRQRCGSQGQEWPCGRQAALALSNWINDRPVSCQRRGTDRYQRVIGRCFVNNEDLQGWMVSNGWALAYRRYSEDYVAAEEHASTARLGMWSGEFVPPWEWRQRSR